MNTNVVRLPGIKQLPTNAPRTVRSMMDTIMLTPDGIDRWVTPPFQREKRITPKVKALIEQLKVDGGVVPGIITLGKLDGVTYIVDGQHRIEAFRQSGLAEGLADVRVCHFDSLADMSDEFVTLNSALVRMTNDDILRGLEATVPNLAALRRRCPFIGYSNVRHNSGTNKIRIAMSVVIRVWFGTDDCAPNNGPPSAEAAKMLTDEEVKRIAAVMTICAEAWGNDPNNNKLWGKLNLAIVFWMWRKLVLREMGTRQRGGVAVVTLTPDQFRLCLMALSANGRYCEWLMGRSLCERDRSPAYVHLKTIFAGRIGGMGIGRPALPNPDWASR